MAEKIVAPTDLRDRVREVTLDFRRDQIEALKLSSGETGPTLTSEVENTPPPRVALPRDHLNCWYLPMLAGDPSMSERIKALLPEWDFYLVEIPTSFRPGERTSIVFAEITVEVRALSPGPLALVYRIIPEQVSSETKEKMEYGLDPSLEIKDAVKLSLGRWIKTVEIGNLKPRVTGFWQEHGASWEMVPTGSDGVLGTKVFYVVLQRGRNSGTSGLNLGAKVKVQTRFGLLFTRRVEFAYQVSYPSLV